MRSTTRPRVLMLATAAVAVLSLGAAACSSTSSSSNDSTTTTVASSTSTSATPTTSTLLTSNEVKAQVQAALLTAAELGPGFTELTVQVTDNPTPCGTPDPDTVVKPAVQVTMGAKSPGGVELQEQISVFDTAAAATDNFALAMAGLNCSTPTLGDGSALTVSGPTDVLAELNIEGLQQAASWTLSSPAVQGQLVVGMKDGLQAAFSAFGAPGTQADADAMGMAVLGLQKLAAS